MSESNRLRGFPPRLCRPLPRHAGYPSLNATACSFVVVLLSLALPFCLVPCPSFVCFLLRTSPFILPLRALDSLVLDFQALSSEPAVSPLSMFLLSVSSSMLFLLALVSRKSKSPASSSRFEDPGLSCSENKNGILFSENPAVVSVYVCVLTSTTAEPPWRARRNRAPA